MKDNHAKEGIFKKASQKMVIGYVWQHYSTTLTRASNFVTLPSSIRISHFFSGVYWKEMDISQRVYTTAANVSQSIIPLAQNPYCSF